MAEIVEISTLRNRIHVFNNRFHAGELLAEQLKEYKGKKEAIVLAVPAGGVPVALQVSKRLNIPLDLAVTRKLHIPWNREAGFGAISWDGIIVLNESLVTSLGLTKEEIAHCVEEERAVIHKRLKEFREDKPFPDLKGKVVIIVDDGLASGFSMLVTVKTIKRKAEEVVVAVPTAPMSAIEFIKPHVDKIFCLNIRSGGLFAVADAYKVWYDLANEDVMDLLMDVHIF